MLSLRQTPGYRRICFQAFAVLPKNSMTEDENVRLTQHDHISGCVSRETSDVIFSRQA